MNAILQKLGCFLDKFYNCNTNCIFQGYLECLFQKDFTQDQLETELGEMMRIITSLMHGFMRMGLTREEYVCLQVILLLNQGMCWSFVSDGQSWIFFFLEAKWVFTIIVECIIYIKIGMLKFFLDVFLKRKDKCIPGGCLKIDYW